MHRFFGVVAAVAQVLAGAILATLVVLLAYSGVQGAAITLGPRVAGLWPGPGERITALGAALPQPLWITEVAEFGLLPIGFLGAGLALRARRHQGIDALTRLFPKRLERATDLFVWAVLAVFGGVFTWLGIGYVGQVIAVGGTLASADVPKWPFYLCYPAAGVLFTLFALEALVETLLGRPVSPSEAAMDGEGVPE